MSKIRHMSKKLDIVGLFLRNYSSSYSGREVARQQKISPQTALTSLNFLIQERILHCATEGRNNKYFLNKVDFKVKLLLQMAEINKALDCCDNFELKSVIQELMPHAETIVVFGSFAKRLEKKDSDLDLIIINPADKEKIRKTIKIFPREVNLEFVSWKEFSDSVKEKRALAVEIMKDHLLYGNVFKVVNIYCS